MIVKKKILKWLHKIIMEIATSDDKTLDEMGKQLLEIEKSLISYQYFHIIKDLDKFYKKTWFIIEIYFII